MWRQINTEKIRQFIAVTMSPQIQPTSRYALSQAPLNTPEYVWTPLDIYVEIDIYISIYVYTHTVSTYIYTTSTSIFIYTSVSCI